MKMQDSNDNMKVNERIKLGITLAIREEIERKKKTRQEVRY